MAGISNNAQAVLVTGSSVLICVGAYTGYTGGNPWIALGLGIVGSIGLGLKEALGILTA
jgi:hypothetical protein